MRVLPLNLYGKHGISLTPKRSDSRILKIGAGKVTTRVIINTNPIPLMISDIFRLLVRKSVDCHIWAFIYKFNVRVI